MNKTGLIFLTILLGVMLITPVMAAECVEDNNVGSAVHIISIVLIVIMVFMTFMAASMFSESLGKAMKIIGSGMIFVGLNDTFTELHHFGVVLIPEGILHTLFHHVLGAVGYLLMAYGFYRVYQVAKGVARKK